MKEIQYTRTLFYYEGPQVIEAVDSIGGSYIGVAVDSDDGVEKFLLQGVAQDALRKFRSGALDLRDLICEFKEEIWYIGWTETLSTPFRLQPMHSQIEDCEFLPDPGFLLHDLPSDSVVLHEARARNNFVLSISVEPPEALAHKIHVSTLAPLLTLLQDLVKYAYRASVKALRVDAQKNIQNEDAYLLDVAVPAAPGSFKVLFEGSTDPDIFGEYGLSGALSKVQELFRYASEPSSAAQAIGTQKGHLFSTYIRLLQFIVDKRMGLSCSWATPNAKTELLAGISQGQARPLLEAIADVSSVGLEIVELVGPLKKVDVKGSWRILHEGKDYSGKVIDGGPSLDGLKTESVYKFTCQEEIERRFGQESTTLYLLSHELVLDAATVEPDEEGDPQLF